MSEKHKPISKDDFERALRRLDKPKPQPQLKERFDNSFRSQSETRSHHRPGNHIEHRVETRPDKRHDGRFSRDMPKATRERPYKPNFLQSRSAGRSEDGLPPRKIALDQPPRFAAQPRKPEGAEKETDFKPRSSSDTPQVKEEEGTFQAHRSGSLYPERPMYSERPQHQDKVDGPIRIHHTTAVSQFLYGRSVVEAALKNGRRKIYRLYIYSGDARKDVSLSQDVELMKLASYKDVKIIKVPRADLRLLNEMSGGRPHNGCVLEASPLPMPPIKCLGVLSQDVEDLNAPEKPGERWFGVVPTWQSQEEVEINGSMNNIIYQLPRDRKPFVLLLEGILDPGNLGAILRSAAFLGVNGVAISKDLSAGLTAVALKASAGASESLTLFSVRNTTDFLHRSKEAGWLVYAAVPSTSRSRGNSHMNVDRLESYDPLATRPTILVVGSEGEGLTQKVRRAADMQVSIPSPAGLYSTVDSLNVSVATGILCAAFMKKQHGGFEIEESVPTENEEDSLW
ncbi:hypothetical protein SLS62_003852 [Diatrype stigma]|uniref:rRNA methyltransferase 1, mitochondrial n=1 Tax=Diatrype stigma TaxID=117547 RepID=A0AAN9UUF7_9PEZI